MAIEIAEAPDAVRLGAERNGALFVELGRRLQKRPPRAVVTCARGSSDHAATFAKYLIETRLGVLTASAAPSVSSIYAKGGERGEVLCLAISQSGRSPDVLASVEAAKDGGAFVIAMVNAEDSPLAGLADVVVPLCAGPETSVAATKSFIASLAAITRLAAEWADDDELREALDQAPYLLERALTMDWTVAADRLRSARNLYVLGRGLGFGVAQEAALKLKETCGLHAEAFSTAEVRHGPLALVEKGFPVLVFTQDDATRAGVEALAGELAAEGADVFLAGQAQSGALPLPTLDAHPVLQPMLSIASFYGMAEKLSRMRGYDPDRPPHLNKVTKTV
jgi:glucosamine--fructose-6-phosphate aminotransferase (isomerizing)